MSQPSRPRAHGPAKRRQARQTGAPMPARGALPARSFRSGLSRCRRRSRRPRRRPTRSWARSRSTQNTTGDDYLDPSPDHLGGRADTAVLVRRRHRADQGRSGRCIRQRTLRDLARRRRQHRRGQPAGRDLPRRSGHGQGQRVLRPQHGHEPDRPQRAGHRRKNPAANSLGASTGFVNWYDIAFDPEGNFDGSPRCSSASVDRSDPSKNAIYMISPSGKFLGAFVPLTDGLAATKFNINPTGMVIPGPEDQAFLRGLLGRQRHHDDGWHVRRALLQLERLFTRADHQQRRPCPRASRRQA